MRYRAFTHRDAMLIDAVMDARSDRDQQGGAVQGVPDDNDFRSRAGALIYDTLAG